MASILNKTSACGVVTRVNVNAIPNYSLFEKLKLCPLKGKSVLDSSQSLMSGKLLKRNLNLWPSSISTGINGPMQVRLTHTDVCKVPDFSDIRRKETLSSTAKSQDTEIDRKFFSYTLMIGGSVACVTAAKDLVYGVVSMWLPNAKTLSEASIEIDLSTIPEGKSAVIKWRNKPLFVRHRTAEDISREGAVNISELRDPQEDLDRVQKPEWLILIGICTHLGCVPVANAGEFNGYYCPCHGSHYDGSGRVRKGPAPANLEIPPYKFLSDTKIFVG